MSLRSLDMSDQDIAKALKPGAGESSSNSSSLSGSQYQVAGWLSLQQLPYECPDSSYEFTSDSDVLKPVVGMLIITNHPYT